MRKTYVAILATALLGFGSGAIADEPVKAPTILTDAQMEKIVAGNNGAWVGGPGAPLGGNQICNFGYVYGNAFIGHHGPQGASVNFC